MPDLYMDVDVNLGEVPVNLLPLLDNTDFKSIEADVNYNATGLVLIWHFVTTAGAYSQTAVTPTDTGGNYDWVEQGNGLFTIEIPATGGATINNDTEGVGWFTGVATGVLPWRGPTICFRRAALNDLFIDGGTASTNLEDFFDGTGYAGGTAKLTVDVTAISGDSPAADNLEAAFDGNTYNVGGGAIVAASVTGAVGSVTGAVGSVTGAVGSVTGAVGSVTGNVGGNVTGSVGSVANGGIAAASFAAGAITAASIATGAIDADAVADGTIDAATFAAGAITAAAIATNAIDADALATDAITEIQAGLATPTNITAGTITTVTNLTNAPANGDFTATVKTSLNAATPASVVGAVGSVAGNVGGNVVGSVGSVAAAVTVGTNNDKTNYSIADTTSDAIIADAVWNAATASYGTANTYGALVESGNVGGGAIVAASVTGAVGSVTGAVGSVTGAVGSVTGSVGSVAGDVSGKVLGGGAGVISATGVQAQLPNDAITAAVIATGAIDADAIADNAIDAGAIADGAIDAATFAAGAITATAIAADAIGASELAADAVAEIADQVWDELIAGHAGVGSTGAALSAAGGSGDPWSTAVPGAYGAGTAGYIVGTNLDATISSRTKPADTQAAVTIVNGLANGVITAAAIATNAIDADALAADAVTEIAAGVPTAAGIADAVWDETLAGHAGAGSAGAALSAASAPTAAAVADAVWDEAIAGHLVAGTTGATLNSASAPTASAVADAVWDEALAGHAGAGSAGQALSAAGGAADPLLNAVPGAYAAGSAGYVIGTNLDAAVSTASAAGVWSYATRTLTQSAAAIATAVSGSTITITRGDTLSAALTGIGALTGYVSIDFTVKADKNDADTSAVIRVRKNASGLSDGLLILNGATGTAAQGSITVNSEALGNITIALSAAASDDLTPCDGLHYDVQLITASGVTTLTEGMCNITADVTRAVS